MLWARGWRFDLFELRNIKYNFRFLMLLNSAPSCHVGPLGENDAKKTV